MPQKPLLKCLFDGVDHIEKLELTTNPCKFEVDGRSLLGISGQNINDTIMYSNNTNAIEIMKKQLFWRHICPTAPDTLRTYPFDKFDPFILTEMPNVYFAGNQEKFDTAILSEGKSAVRLISIPKFVSTHCFALMDIETLDAFNVDLSQKDTTIS